MAIVRKKWRKKDSVANYTPMIDKIKTFVVIVDPILRKLRIGIINIGALIITILDGWNNPLH